MEKTTLWITPDVAIREQSSYGDKLGMKTKTPRVRLGSIPHFDSRLGVMPLASSKETSASLATSFLQGWRTGARHKQSRTPAAFHVRAFRQIHNHASWLLYLLFQSASFAPQTESSDRSDH